MGAVKTELSDYEEWLQHNWIPRREERLKSIKKLLRGGE